MNQISIEYLQNLCEQVKYPELVEPFTKFYNEAIESMQQKRLPRYDYLYKIFDDALYRDGRDRSQRIVFEWLTEEGKAAAMIEEIPSIESIIFQKDSEEMSHRMARSLGRHRSTLAYRGQ